MNGRLNAGPLSPVSLGDSEEGRPSSMNKYQNPDGLDNPSSINARGQLASPPISSGSVEAMNGNGSGFPVRPANDRQSSGPSPPASIARSSAAGSFYNGSSTLFSDRGGGSRNGNGKAEDLEGLLAEHYASLKRYLASSLREDMVNPRPTKARDKLLRLSFVQFQELSTDVHDELLRRQAAGRKQNSANGSESGPPPFLMAKDTFHPKRNQARQKLSTLPPPRFRDLATDVFYELERRFPNFQGAEIPRANSPASTRGTMRSRTGTPTESMMRPGSRGGLGMRRPSESSSVGQFPRSNSRQASRGNDGSSLPSSPGIPPSEFRRPLAKTFQSNTIVPNKSTMIEDDDDTGADNDDDEEDAFALESAARASNETAATSESDKKVIAEYQLQIVELREKLGSMEESLRRKDDELQKALEDDRGRSTALGSQDREWSDLRLKLENQLADAQNLNMSMQSELDRIRADHSNSERSLRDELNGLRTSAARTATSNDSVVLAQQNEELRTELRQQQQAIDDCRREAQEFLAEMRQLTQQGSATQTREEDLLRQVKKLESELPVWRDRYARAKTQLRSLKASSMGITPQHNAMKLARASGFVQENGLVEDVHVTRFQIAVDELLSIARRGSPDEVVDYMKAVVMAVRTITQDLDSSNASGQATPEQTKLKVRISATANNLITASKNFANAKGVSPVSLLDAAASHLSMSIVDLLRVVKIRPTPAGELEVPDDADISHTEVPSAKGKQGRGTAEGLQYGDGPEPSPLAAPPPFMGFGGNRDSNVSSMYSPANSPRISQRPRSSGQWTSRRSLRNGAPPVPQMSFDTEVEDLKIYLQDQTANLVSSIQALVSSIRTDTSPINITTSLSTISSTLGTIVTRTSSTTDRCSPAAATELSAIADVVLERLSDVRERIDDQIAEGKAVAGDGVAEVKKWMQGLPPLMFEAARETKELLSRVGGLSMGGGAGM